jgi:DNA helicase-4
MQGVDYEYERPYEHDTADLQYRQYRPDFYLPAINAYLEHYALDKHGRPPVVFGEERYMQSMFWKEQLHADKATALITTTFADFVSGELFPKLKAELQKRGQRFSPRPMEDVLARLNEFQKTNYASFLRTFLKHAKSNEVDEGTMRTRAEANPQPYRAQVFVRVFWKLMTAYETKLCKNGEIDFEDMIIKAAHDVATHRYQHSYKLILVDEFQDISQARAKLLKALLAQAPDCKLFAVGDDWQSINRFAGSDIDVFTHFPEGAFPFSRLKGIHLL